MKNYTIEVKEYIEKPKKKEQPRKSSFSWDVLVLAIFATLILSPDLIDLKQYIPKEYQHENTNRF